MTLRRRAVAAVKALGWLLLALWYLAFLIDGG